jgi:hypothetical protein
MSEEISSGEWIAAAKKEFIKQGVTLPEDDELWELAYMECMNEGTSIEVYTKQEKALQDKHQQ